MKYFTAFLLPTLLPSLRLFKPYLSLKKNPDEIPPSPGSLFYFIGCSEVELFVICVLNAKLFKTQDLPVKLTLYLAHEIVLSDSRDSINFSILILFSAALL